MKAIFWSLAAVMILMAAVPAVAGTNDESSTPVEYKLLATSKTSTMEKEMNQAAGEGFRFEGVMGGETAFGGSEAVVIVSRNPKAAPAKRFQYLLLATNRTSTMQKEIQEAGDKGYEYRGQSVFSSAFGGREVVVILERDMQADGRQFEYKLLATSKTSTMQKELTAASSEGYLFSGISVGKTALGGNEVVVILHKRR